MTAKVIPFRKSTKKNLRKNEQLGKQPTTEPKNDTSFRDRLDYARHLSELYEIPIVNHDFDDYDAYATYKVYIAVVYTNLDILRQHFERAASRREKCIHIFWI